MIQQPFNSFIVVDWSASSIPKSGKDSLWIACLRPGQPLVLENPRTRHLAMQRIETLLREDQVQGFRTLAGFDFAFGYPAGLAQALGPAADWRQVWAWIHDHLTDGPDNANDRFDMAARLNALFACDGPFWGNGLARDIPGLPRKKPVGWGEGLPQNRRLADRLAPGAQEVWKLSGAGSVGGQSLTGIAALEGLRRRMDVTVWPFQAMTDAPVLAEVFPSLVPLDTSLHSVRDAAQVIGLACQLAEWGATGHLETLLQAANALPADVRNHEAMILGLPWQG